MKKVFTHLNLSINDDYLKFYNIDNIQKFSQKIKNLVNVTNDNKRRKFRYIKEFINCAYNMEPDYYKNSLILNFPKIERTKKSEQHPHLPYTKEQLKEIFSPTHSFFKDNKDIFWICMIALFTGARANAASTLQYKDLIEYEGLKCIYFRANYHYIKRLKNEASERIVPIHQQLLDLGFWNYVEQSKRKLKAKPDDFIFPKCKTQKGNYNNKYMVRTFFVFLHDIKIKAKGYDFHSLRKNASIAMQSAGLIPTVINAIIG